ncbi:30S ribosomal protein S8 [Candidatus Parcubacteria bacterium]|nr:30S ribosomal protein S8 [Patescibacteria group bacterium]MBU4477168.1 30S ribosomal protein S8 [Patescibacteria group bacterium]MCG2698903.1 30S ribosomal protein S8 [Candidatus Parcubacteria bacterium]
MINDPIADMLTTIRNAVAVKKETAVIPYSQIKMGIAKILEKEKFIKAAERKGKKIGKTIDIVLAYDEKGNSAISRITRVSKPSKRNYLPFKKIRSLRQGAGIQIISTPKGILTDKEARKEKVGGEVICEVW